ncbi:methylated-DNA--[protein]-cysteine S-methyltransferase [Granulicella mallensis]|uniref:Methylated-DNA--protein-cysteine methyltransferase n=1 Tax=Granulicella mallensis (strain ATCC BAA-1857 / DSM 23137 / MP5ACTX8) TaxID=682795 RepID=G8NW53_GRAMM|nr:methylated-DNA--[protein]-cysteine S-methyltransferase [Granulicella mallensis]AEU35473.1 methylated-DNA/protein-cysteine methyltransferase [Granulicella mallensis MP5ACTX8]
MVYKIIDTPVGRLKLIASDNGLVAILWENDNPRRVRLGELAEDERHPVLLETERQLGEYFKGKRKSFSLPLDMRGTQFQRDVWEALLAIPFGETRSYGQLAKQLGNPKATRAVGAANGRNPISIIVPCHRVIGSSGKLTGFAGGLARKELLLDLEGNVRSAHGIEAKRSLSESHVDRTVQSTLFGS